MTPTRLRTLVTVFAFFGLACWLLFRLIYLSLPPLPWTAAPTLLVLAIAEAASGYSVRVRLRAQRGEGSRRGSTPRPIPPIAVARLAVLAKASSLAAAIFGGIAAGALVYLAGLLGKDQPRADALASGATLGAAILLTAAALYLEYGCRVPPPPRHQGGGPPGSGPPGSGPPPGHPG